MIDKLLNRYELSRRQGLGLIALTVAAVVVYMTFLGINGYANGYYAAAAQAGSENWWAFLFGAVDMNASITVDKPPLAIWITSLSVRLFGLNSYGLLLPQAVMGVISMLLVVALVRKHFGYRAGFMAGLTFLITPVTALIFRYNNPDALLTLLTIITVLLIERFNDTGKWRFAALLGVFVGLGFLTKTFQAFIILPALLVIVLLFGRYRFGRRLAAIGLSVLTMLVTAGFWLAIVTAVPQDARPYIGGSESNSAFDLAFGYNGLGRLFGVSQPIGGNLRVADNDAGVIRLFSDVVGGEVGWFLPLALMTFVIAAVLFWRTRREDTRFFDILLYGSSIISLGIVFSGMKGIFHGYYAVQMVPFIAAFVGIFVSLFREYGDNYRFRVIFTAVLFISGVYSSAVPYLNNDTNNALALPVFALTILATILLLVPPRLTNQYRSLLLFVIVVALGAGPSFYTYATIMTPHTGSNITAGPYVQRPNLVIDLGKLGKNDSQMGEFDNLLTTIANSSETPSIRPETITYLSQDAAKYRYPVAVVGGQNAAGYQLLLNKPVLMMGGFGGTDPFPSFEEFRALALTHQIHYFVLSSAGPISTSSQYDTTVWVSQHYASRVVGNVRIYDLNEPLRP